MRRTKGRGVSRFPEAALGDVLRRANRFEAKDELAEYVSPAPTASREVSSRATRSRLDVPPA